jgi:rhodanese-related sulfurtransferase
MYIRPVVWKASYAFLAAVVLAVPRISPSEALQYVGSRDVVFLDVREASEYETGHVPGSRLMPWNSGVLQERWQELPVDRLIIVYCASGARSARAAQFLQDMGLQQLADMGEFSTYRLLPDAPIETGPYKEPTTSIPHWILY